MKLPEIKKPDIKLPDLKKLELKKPQLKRADDDEVGSEKRSFKKPDIKMPKASFKLSEGTMMKLWAGCSVVCIACSGIALVVAMF